MQATAGRGSLALSASLTLVKSTVHRIAEGYQGDLRPCDRMLEVPARTFGATASWSAARWSASARVARASDWINYDRLALAAAYAADTAGGGDGPSPVGAGQREFWRRYDGVTRLGARGEVRLWRTIALTLRGENLLDRQLGEPDNVTVLPGRTVLAGVRTGF